MLPRPLPLNVYKVSAEYTRTCDLGEGGDAVVSAWTHKTTGQVIAMKSCAKGTDNQELLKEVQFLLKTRDCPHIISLLGSSLGTDPGFKATIFLEYCEYGDANDFRDALVDEYGFLPEQTLWKLFIDISKALKFIHDTNQPFRRPILHLDLKPGNILVSRPKDYRYSGEGLPVVPDFKLADFTRSLFWSPHKVPEKAEGTPEFMPPEWKEGVTPSTDIWSLGATIQSLALNVMPTISIEAYKASYISLHGTPKEGDDYEFWRNLVPGKYRPINLSKEEQVKFLGFERSRTCTTYSNELNRWYHRCMVNQHMRITAEELVRDMVPVGEAAIERLQRDKAPKPLGSSATEACQIRYNNKTPYPGPALAHNKGKVAEAVSKLESASSPAYITYYNTSSSSDDSDKSGPKVPIVVPKKYQSQEEIQKDASETVMAGRKIAKPRAHRGLRGRRF